MTQTTAHSPHKRCAPAPARTCTTDTTAARRNFAAHTNTTREPLTRICTPPARRAQRRHTAQQRARRSARTLHAHRTRTLHAHRTRTLHAHRTQTARPPHTSSMHTTPLAARKQQHAHLQRQGARGHVKRLESASSGADANATRNGAATARGGCYRRVSSVKRVK